MATRRLVLIGLAVGCLTLGIGYLARAVFGIPLLPEEAGGLLVKVLPLPVFEAVIRTLGVLARPLLLVGSTVGLIVLFGAATVIIDRRLTVSRGPAIAGVIGLVTLAVGLVAGDGIPALIEATVLAVAGTIAYSFNAKVSRIKASEGVIVSNEGMSGDARKMVQEEMGAPRPRISDPFRITSVDGIANFEAEINRVVERRRRQYFLRALGDLATIQGLNIGQLALAKVEAGVRPAGKDAPIEEPVAQQA